MFPLSEIGDFHTGQKLAWRIGGGRKREKGKSRAVVVERRKGLSGILWVSSIHSKRHFLFPFFVVRETTQFPICLQFSPCVSPPPSPPVEQIVNGFERKKKSKSPVLVMNGLLFTCGAADRSRQGKCCSSSSSCCCCWGDHFSYHCLLMYTQKGCEKNKTFARKRCEKNKTFAEREVWKGQNFCQERGVKRTKLARKRCENELRQLAIIFYITFLPIKMHTSFGKSKFTKKLAKYQNHIIYYVSRRRSLKGSLSCLKEVPEELISRQLFQCGKPSVSEHRKKGTQFKTQNCAKGVSRLFPKYISFEATCLNRRRLLLASLKQNNCETIAFSFPLHPHYYRVASAEEYSKRTTSDATFLSQTHFSS